ncbi:MAG: T9SS type A sorting domain-containing protein [Bacteroidia bacterium]|nr:T9SS type A sorting domain-containing protein [Bacteroidia bacterium]
MNDGTYNVCLSATNSCGTTTFCQTITSVGIAEGDFSEYFRVYPNPSSGIFTLEANLHQQFDMKVRVYSLLGEEVWYRNEGKAGQNFQREIDLTHVAKGTYFLEIELNGRRLMHKLITQ